MEMLLKINKEADLPKFYKNTLMNIVQNEEEHLTTKGKDKVVIFPTCFVNYNNPNFRTNCKRNFSKT